MPVPTDITAGTLTITNGSTAVTGVGTSWLASDLRQGDVILWIEGGDGFQTPILADVPASNTALTLIEPWEGPTLTGVRYRIRYQWDSSRVSAQNRQLIELLDNGNTLALSGLTGPGVPVFDGPHSMTIRPETDFTRGVEYDVQVDTLADRASYDGQAAGYSVLVSDVGDGRSAVYSKASNASGDWTDPAYVTGPIGASGPFTELTFGPVTTGAPGSDASVNVVVLDPDTVRLDFTLPAGYNGTGTVTGLVAGDGIIIDDSDPTLPVISVDPEAIETDSLELDVTQIATSKAINAVLLLPNGFANGFRGTDGINASQSVDYEQNLSTGSVFAASGTPTMIPQSTGADIGSFTSGGGFAAARDGVTNQSYDDSARTSTTTGSIGRDYGVAPKKISHGVAWASNDFGFDATNSPTTITINLRAKNGTIPSTHSDGVLLGSWVGADALGLSVNIPSSDKTTEYRYVWFEVSSPSGALVVMAEAQFFTPGPIGNMTVVTEIVDADAEPDLVDLRLTIRPLETLTLNSDLTAEVSRDGFATWTTAPLTQTASLGADRLCVSDAIDLSAQPIGNEIAVRVKTLNNTMVELRGVKARWN